MKGSSPISINGLQVIEIDNEAASSVIFEAFSAQPGDIYLVRPDMFVAGRWRGEGLDVIKIALNHILQNEEIS